MAHPKILKARQVSLKTLLFSTRETEDKMFNGKGVQEGTIGDIDQGIRCLRGRLSHGVTFEAVYVLGWQYTIEETYERLISRFEGLLKFSLLELASRQCKR